MSKKKSQWINHFSILSDEDLVKIVLEETEQKPGMECDH